MVRIRTTNKKMRARKPSYESRMNYGDRYPYPYDGKYPHDEYYSDYDRPKPTSRYYDPYIMDYSNGVDDKEYHRDLEEWGRKLKSRDRFNVAKEEIIRKAKEMNATFKGYDEDEFYTTYLMHVSDYVNISNDPHTYIAMAKLFLEDDDIEVSPSEKLCIYMYEIVYGEE